MEASRISPYPTLSPYLGAMHILLAFLLTVSAEECSEGSCAATAPALLQAGANRTGNHTATAQLEYEESLLHRAHVRHTAELELESAVAGKGRRRRRSRRRTTTTTTTVDCGSTVDSYAIGWDTSGSIDYCAEGLNTGAATEQIDSSQCPESTRNKWIFADDGNGYCTMVAQYNDGHRRRNHKGTSVTCGTSSTSVAYCKVNGNQGYKKLKLEDLGNGKFKMWWYTDSSNTGLQGHRDAGAGGGGIIIADYGNGDAGTFYIYKNAVYSNTCRLSASDLGVACWK